MLNINELAQERQKRDSNYDNKWDVVIKPAHSAFEFQLKAIWEYRDLLYLFVKRDFVSFYKQTIFGPLWFFLQPIFTTLIFTFVFSGLAKIKTNDVPPPLFYLAGTIAWSYFSECLLKTSTVFRDNVNIFGKVYFPRLILPISIVISNLLKFVVQFALFVFVYVWFLLKGRDISPNICIFLLPLIIIAIASLGLGLGLMVTALTTKYRDLIFVVTFGVQLLMYASPVIYPLSEAPVKFQFYINLNPLSGLLEMFRYGLLGGGQAEWGAFAYSIGLSFAVLVLGIFAFNKAERSFVDTI